MTLAMDAESLSAFMHSAFPQAAGDYAIDHIDADRVLVRLKVEDRHLRPGGTVSGPAIFSLADIAIYLAVLAKIGPVALAVTTNCSIDFLRKPEAGRDLIATTKMLKLGRVLAVGDVAIRSEGSEDLVARATLTYSIPPAR